MGRQYGGSTLTKLSQPSEQSSGGEIGSASLVEFGFLSGGEI